MLKAGILWLAKLRGSDTQRMHEEITYINVYGAPEGPWLYYGVSHEQPWFRQNSEAQLSVSLWDGLCMRCITLQREVPFSAVELLWDTKTWNKTKYLMKCLSY